MADRVGQQFGNYQLIRLLGEGGFAQVYLGEHIHLGTQVAIKVLSLHLSSKDIEQFQNEARIIAHFEHPHIVRVFDFGVKDNTPFFVMSYAPGGILRQRHPKGARVPLLTVISYINQIAPALQYAHFRKYVHRDIKPENILIGLNNKLMLSDFGISIAAHQPHSLTPQAIMGTPYYMSPEQSQGQALPASDQYSLGVMVYEWLSGKRPFNGSSSVEIMLKHLSTPPPSLRDAVPSLSLAIEQVVLKAIAKNPTQRFASVSAFGKALEQAYLMEQHITLSSTHVGSTLSLTQESQRQERRAATPAKKSSTGSLLYSYQIPQKSTYAFSWTSKGHFVALGDASGKIEVWNMATGVLIITNDSHTTSVDSIIWSPNGNYIASSSFEAGERIVHVWDANNGGNITSHKVKLSEFSLSSLVSLKALFRRPRTEVSWSPDSTCIAFRSCNEKTIQIWDIHLKKHILTLHGRFEVKNSFGIKEELDLVWSPNGTYIASLVLEGNKTEPGYGQDEEVWAIQVIEVKSGNCIATCSFCNPPWPSGGTGYAAGWSMQKVEITWSPNGNHIASDVNYYFHGRGPLDQETSRTMRPRQVQIWEIATAKEAVTPRSVEAFSWSPDSTRVAFANYDKTVEIWDVVLKKGIGKYDDYTDSIGTRSRSHYPPVLAWSSDGKRIASSGFDGTVQVWDANSKKRILTLNHISATVTWSPNGTQVSTVNQDNIIQVWQVI